MPADVSYELVVSDMYRLVDGVLHGAQVEIAILDGVTEVDRIKRSGMIKSGSHRSRYTGPPGLTAKVVEGECKVALRAAVTPAA